MGITFEFADISNNQLLRNKWSQKFLFQNSFFILKKEVFSSFFLPAKAFVPNLKGVVSRLSFFRAKKRRELDSIERKEKNLLIQKSLTQERLLLSRGLRKSSDEAAKPVVI